MISGPKRYLLRVILTGSVCTQHYLSRAGRADSAACPFCTTGEREDLEHLWWRCPAWRAQRER